MITRIATSATARHTVIVTWSWWWIIALIHRWRHVATLTHWLWYHVPTLVWRWRHVPALAHRRWRHMSTTLIRLRWRHVATTLMHLVHIRLRLLAGLGCSNRGSDGVLQLLLKPLLHLTQDVVYFQ